MRVLIIKTSSMGDVIHTLPAVTELGNNINNLTIDWVVEEGFVDIPKYHKYVNKIIPVAIRRWRKNLFKLSTIAEIRKFLNNLRCERYDYIIDAQGLLKSAILAKLAYKTNSLNTSKDDQKLNNIAQLHGLDYDSARGKYISGFYDRRYSIDNNMHAIYRVKLLFARVFNYSCDFNNLDYGLDLSKLESDNQMMRHHQTNNSDGQMAANKPYLVFLHCTTWSSKKWPKVYWQELIKKAINNGYKVYLNSGNQQEYKETVELIESMPNNSNLLDKTNITAMPPQSIANLINVLANSQAIVAVDTGLGHLAAALDVPGVGLYGATNTDLTGFLSHKFVNFQSGYNCSPCLLKNCDKNIVGSNSDKIYPPCYEELSSVKVWESLKLMLDKRS